MVTGCRLDLMAQARRCQSRSLGRAGSRGKGAACLGRCARREFARIPGGGLVFRDLEMGAARLKELLTWSFAWPRLRRPARAGVLSRRGRRQAEAAARTGREGEPRIERCELRPEELGERHVPGLIDGQARVAGPLAGLLLPPSEVGYLHLQPFGRGGQAICLLPE